MSNTLELPEWMQDGVLIGSFCVHGGLFLFLYSQHKSVRDGCTQVSLFHHTIAFFVGIYCSYLYIADILNRPTLKPNDLFPWTQWLTRFNAGYFAYDSIHVCIWDQVFIPHHFVVLVGLIGTDLGNVTALTNSVNTWMTEIGSLLYNMYIYKKSETTYLIFLVAYAASRMVLAAWSCYVFYDIWAHIFAGTAVPGPYAAAFYCSLQVLLLGSNAHFLWMHYKKFTAMRAKNAAKLEAKELKKMEKQAKKLAVPQDLSKVLQPRPSDSSSVPDSSVGGESDCVEAIIREYSSGKEEGKDEAKSKKKEKSVLTDTLLTSSVL